LVTTLFSATILFLVCGILYPPAVVRHIGAHPRPILSSAQAHFERCVS
jgi:hypothetical protein